MNVHESAHEEGDQDELAAFNRGREPVLNERGDVKKPTTQVVHDPVCHMDIPANQAASSVERDGFTYYFCSDSCRATFDRSPDEIIEAENAYTHQEPAPAMTEVPRPIV